MGSAAAGSHRFDHPPCPAVGGGVLVLTRRRRQSQLDTVPSLPCQNLRYANGARGGHAPCFRITRSTGAGARRGCLREVLQEAHPLILLPPRRSTWAPFLQASPSASSTVLPAASSHRQVFIFSFSRNATGVDQDNAAGLAVEHASDYHLLEKRMLLEAAACGKTNAPARCSHPRGLSIPAPGSRAAPAQAVEPAILTAAHACCECPSAAQQVCHLCPKGSSGAPGSLPRLL